MPTSGQRRVNAKRTARGEFWRTVRIRVSVEVEPYFRRNLHLLGNGARIDGAARLREYFGSDLHVHIPGAPTNAVTAEPQVSSVFCGDHYEPVVDGIQYWDADGQRIEVAA